MLATSKGSGIGYGRVATGICVMHESRHSSRRWFVECPKCESIHVYDTCIDSAGVNELAWSRCKGVNRGEGVCQLLLHVPRECVRGPIQALLHSHNSYWRPCSLLEEIMLT